MNQVAPPAGNTLEDSIHSGHSAANRAEAVLDAIWSDLTGNDTGETACGGPLSSGLVWSADTLATRLSGIANRLEDVRGRITSPKVAGLATAQNSIHRGSSILGGVNLNNPNY